MSNAQSAPRGPAPAGAGPRRGRDGGVSPWVFLLAAVALLGVFTYLPVINMFWYSFTDWDGLDQTKNFVGLENYARVFTQPENLRVFYVSLYYFIASFFQLALALYFATVLSFNVKFRNLWKGFIFFPYLINGVAIGLIFNNFLRPDGGLDETLRFLGLDALITQWTGNPDIVNITLASVSVWRYLGLNFVLFLGNIQAIHPELYEAADIDGANRWQQFRHLIVPAIKPIISLSAILAISGSLSVFEIPFIMTNGANGSETFVIRTVRLAFKLSSVGLASAMAVVLLAIVLLVTGLQRLLVPEDPDARELRREQRHSRRAARQATRIAHAQQRAVTR